MPAGRRRAGWGRREEKSMITPWGDSQTVHDIGNGVLSVSTASHGGLYVPDYLLSRIPEKEQAYAERWSGSRNWYEEDCAAAIPLYRLPEVGTLEDEKRQAYYNSVRGYFN